MKGLALQLRSLNKYYDFIKNGIIKFSLIFINRAPKSVNLLLRFETLLTQVNKIIMKEASILIMLFLQVSY